MNVKYLCASHSQQLRNFPKQAIRAWSKSYETGLSLKAMDYKFEALSHLGCAFEAAEIVLSSKTILTIDAVAMLTSSAATLAKVLAELGNALESQRIVDLTVNRIAKEIANHSELEGILRHQITSLHYFVEDSEQYEYPIDEKQLSILNLVSTPTSASLH